MVRMIKRAFDHALFLWFRTTLANPTRTFIETYGPTICPIWHDRVSGRFLPFPSLRQLYSSTSSSHMTQFATVTLMGICPEMPHCLRRRRSRSSPGG